MATTVSSQPRQKQSQLQDTALKLLLDWWAWFFLIGLIIYFSITGNNFLSARNFANIGVSSTMIMLMAIGQTYVIITAGIDLSIGWTVGLASVICATVMRDQGNAGASVNQAIFMGVAAGLGVSLIPGFMNGILITKIRVPPFIATIGMFGIVRGAAFLLTSGKNVVGDIPPDIRESLRSVGNGSLLYRIPDEGLVWLHRPDDLTRLQLRGLERLAPYPILITLVVVVIFAFVLARTKFGRYTYAIGGNEEASRRAGINVDRHLILIYMLAAFAAGIAGVLHVFRFTAGAPNIAEPALLDSVAAVVIGGTSLFGGEGTIRGTVIGALIIAVLQTGLVILNVDALWQFIVVGCTIIVAVVVNRLQDYLTQRQANRE